MFDFPRSESVPFPRVWSTFEARDSNSDEIVKYRIEDVPEDRFTDVVEFMMNNFANEEVVLDTLSNNFDEYFSHWFQIKLSVCFIYRSR